MSIETEINRISTNVSGTLSAISEMGGEVPENATSDDMASGVRSIPVGAKIDDTTPSSTTTYSSQKIESELTALNEANATQNTEIAKKANDAELAPVAKSGSYNDLTNKPTIPTVPTTLPNPNKLKLTGAVTAEYDGSAPVSVEIPTGGSGSYTLPVASPTTLGGVMPAAKTNEMTQAVGVDDAGGLWALPGTEYTGAFELVKDETITADVSLIDIDAIGGAENVKLIIRARFNNEANDAAKADNTVDLLVNQGGRGYQYSGKFGYVRQSGNPIWTYVDIRDYYVGPLIHVYDMGETGISSPRSNTGTGFWNEGEGIQRIRIYTKNGMLFKANTRIIMLKK